MLGCPGLFGAMPSWTVLVSGCLRIAWCQAVLDCSGVRLSSDCLVLGCPGLFWRQAVFGLLGVRLSWTLVSGYPRICLMSGCPGLSWCQAVLDCFGVRLSLDCLVLGSELVLGGELVENNFSVQLNPKSS